ncbi:unnamed protein product [Closterium sp. NIES-53]
MGANGGLVGLGNVLLVEGLSANLLSVRRLQKSKAKVTFGPTSCRAKLGKLLLWDLEEKSSCIKDLWQLPIIPRNGKPPATAAAAATAKTTAGGEETAPTDGALDAVKKVQQSQQPHGEVLAGVDATAAWAKASSRNGDADWETWHERLCLINIPMLQKLVKDGSLKALEVKGAAKEIGSCPTCLETKFTKFPFSSGTGLAKTPLALVHMDVVGPMRAPSLSASRYFLTIVDGHTRAVWVYPLKTKGEVAAAVLKEWMPRAQRESGHKVKVIRTDRLSLPREYPGWCLEYSAVRQRLQRGAADLGKGEMLLTCYTDASFNSVKADGTSIRGYVCLFGGGAVSWRSKKQNEVGQSSCEIEYMALHHGAKEVVWLRRLLEEIGVCQKEPTVIFCDNESAVKLAKNACLHGLTKHIRPKWHWVRRLLDKEVRLEIVKTHQQAADILTKRLAESEHWKGMKLAGMSVH